MQIIFRIYSQASNLIANPGNEERRKEGKKSGRKRTASTKDIIDHHEKKVWTCNSG